MQITITARHFELTNAIRDHVEAACEKLDRYFDHIINVHLVLELEGTRTRAEMNLHASHFNLSADSEDNDMYLAVDTVIDKMEAQVKKLKEKITNHQKKSLKREYAYSRAQMVTRDNRTVIKTKRIVAEPMTVNEAMDQLDETENDYFVFRNLETDRVNVLVKKGDAHYKLIEP